MDSDVRKSLILPCDVIHSAVSIDVVNQHAGTIEILDEDIKALFERVPEKCTKVITGIEKWKKVLKRFVILYYFWCCGFLSSHGTKRLAF
jgi:hypothetical protein